MTAGIFGSCEICGQPVRKPGDTLCVRHDFQALIALGYHRMIERVKGNLPSQARRVIGASRQNACKGNYGKV